MHENTDLNVAWSSIDGVGLVRVIPIDSFKVGFVVLASVGKAAEELGYYPEVTLNSAKLVITMPEDTDGRDHELARQIDQILGDESEENEQPASASDAPE